MATDDPETTPASVPVLNYQPPREREGLVVPIGLSALIMVLSYMALGVGILIGLIAWTLFDYQRGWRSGGIPTMAIGLTLFVFGFLGRWFAIHASRYRK